MNTLRDQFPILQEYTYLNTARFSAQPHRVISAQKAFLDHLQHKGSWEFAPWNERYEHGRNASASLIGAHPEQVFFLPNVSMGMNLASQYLPKLPVLCLKRDFPTVNITWEPHGYQVEHLDHLEVDFREKLEKALIAPPKIISMSWIQAADGFELDVDFLFRICKEKGHILVLDATQGVGAIPFRVDPDVRLIVLVSGFKWTLAGYGVAIGYISDHLIKHFEPVRGWNSLDATGGLKKGAISLEVGNATYINVFALGEGLQMIMEIGIDAIQKNNLELKQHLTNQLTEIGRSFRKNSSRSSILSMEATEEDWIRLEKARIQTSRQPDRIRISPNFYNNFADIDRLIDVLKY